MTGKVIVADDEVIVRADICERLALKGYEVLGEASDGLDAIELCRRYEPDVALLDIKMPLIDGLSAAQIINEENLARSIILLTAYSDDEFIAKAGEAGATGYLIKPVKDEMLIAALELGIARGQELNRLKDELEEKEKMIEDRKIIEKAKGYIMKTKDMDENTAYKFLRSVSMEKRMSMRQLSEIILKNKII